MKPLKPAITPFLLATLALIFADCAQAQVIPDDTVGTTVTNDTIIRQTGDGDVNVIRDLIRGGTISGNALFHSFEEFNVGELREVIFDLQGADIEAIFTRVTGGNPSNIADVLGVLEDAASFTRSLRNLNDENFGDETALGDVNLFLLNPNGISFAPQARLRLNGSFLATTADGFEFEDGSIFSASGREPAPPLLTISIPRFLSFRDNPGGIINRATRGGGLRVPEGQTLGLIGGEVQYLTGASRTADGRIEIGAVGSNERVTLTETAGGYQVSYEGVDAFEDIALRREFPETDTRRSNINVDGEGLGSIQLQGRNITLTNNSRVRSNSPGSKTPGAIIINASERFTIEDDSRLQATVVAGDVVAPEEGVSITINTRELLIQSGGWIDTRVRENTQDQEQLGGQADGGDITINATDFVRIIGTVPGSDPDTDNSILSLARENSVGNSGNIIITTGRLILEDGARISASSSGIGNAGDINVNADNITIDGSSITANNTNTDGGNINLNVDDLLLLRNGNSLASNDGNIDSDGNLISTQAGNNGGNIDINANLIVAFPGENSDISANGGQNGGNITIRTNGIFGIQEPDGEESDATNDITATGGVSGGDITITSLSSDFNQEVIDLPEEVVDRSDITAQSVCSQGFGSQLANIGRGGVPQIPGFIIRNDVVDVELVEEVLLPAPPPEAIKPHHRTDVTFLDSEGEEFKPAMGAVLLPNGMVEFVDYNPAQVYRDLYAAAGCNK